MADALLVIDMLKGFLEEGRPLYCGEKARAIIPHIKELIENELKKGSKVFFICDSHAPDDAEFRMFPPHCVKGTAEAEVITELAEYEDEVIPKTRYSAFYETSLEEKLKSLKPEKVIVCGVCTDICIMHTVADLRNRDYDVYVLADCVASFDEEAHSFALKHMEKVLGARITTLQGD